MPEGTVILAEEQFAGRGQFSNTWLSEPGQNLTCSILLRPTFLDVHKQFQLNIAVSIAINETLREFIGEGCKIKWPNDVFFLENKLGGILIENSVSGNTLKHAIVGIGINVNQTTFPDSIKNITSLRAVKGGGTIDLDALLRRLCEAIEKRYLELKEGRHQEQLPEYLSNLYRFGKLHRYALEGREVEGIILGVREDGQLLLEIAGEVRCYGFKEIRFIYD